VVTLLAAALWLLVIVAPERRTLPNRVEYGWPWRFATRHKPDYSSGLRDLSWLFHLHDPPPAKSVRRHGLALWEGRGPVEFRAVEFFADVALALGVLILLGVCLERRRRRVRSFWQLSLREIAVLVLLAAIPCACWGSLYRQTQRQAAVLTALEGVLARAPAGDGISNTLWQSRYEVEFQTKGDWFLELIWDQETKPCWFAETVSLKLTVEQDVADEAVSLLSQLPSLQELSVEVYGGNRRLSDESVQAIADLRLLRDLTIRRIGGGWDMSVVGLADAQVAHLARLTDLERLDLSNNYVTDEGLRHLHGLKRLAVLEIANNAITDAGVSDLTQAVPGLAVLDD
jgi:hypothetical protein